MRRTLLFTLLMSAAGLGLTACGGDSGDASTTVTTTIVSADDSSPDSTTQAPTNSGIVPPNKRAEVLCSGSGDSSDQVCVLKGQQVTVVKNTVGGDLTCEVRRANGAGNMVAGSTKGACTSLRG